MTAKDPDGSGPYAKNASSLTYSLRDKGTLTGIKTKFYRPDLERDLVAFCLDSQERAEVVSGKVDISDFGDPFAKEVMAVIQALVKAGKTVSTLSIAENITNRPSAMSELIRLQANAPIYSEREIQSRLHDIKEASENRHRFDLAVKLQSALESGDNLGATSAIKDLIRLETTVINPSGARLSVAKASEIEPDIPDWISPCWIARSALHILAGQQEAGKTTFTTHLCASATKGRLDGIKHRVGWLSLEESKGRIAARFLAHDSDLDNVVIIGGIEDTAKGKRFTRAWRANDAVLLEDAIEENSLSMLVVDGIGYSITGSQDYANVGSQLTGLQEVASKTGCAIIGLTHVKKGGSDDAVTVAIGSTAWGSVARVGIVVGVVQGKHCVAVNKSNYKKPPHGWSFDIVEYEPLEVGIVANLQPSDITADEIVAPKESLSVRRERQEAKEFLQKVLANGPMETKALSALADSEGISGSTLKRAKGDLKCISKQTSSGHWDVSLPNDENTKKSETTDPIASIGLIDPIGLMTRPVDQLDQLSQLEPIEPVAIDPVCRVCKNPLLFPDSVAKGICAKRDDAHHVYFNSEEPPPLSDDDIAAFDAIFEQEAS